MGPWQINSRQAPSITVLLTVFIEPVVGLTVCNLNFARVYSLSWGFCKFLLEFCLNYYFEKNLKSNLTQILLANPQQKGKYGLDWKWPGLLAYNITGGIQGIL